MNWLRTELGLPVAEFAICLKCDRSYIYKLEKGISTNPSTEFIESICSMFGVKRPWLETGAGAPFVSQSTANMAQSVGKTVALAKASMLWRRDVDKLSISELKELALRYMKSDGPVVLGVEAFDRLSLDELREAVRHFATVSSTLPLFLQGVYSEIAAHATVEFRRRVDLLNDEKRGGPTMAPPKKEGPKGK